MESNEARTTEHKLTAGQVEGDCPAILQELGKRIAVHLEKARKCEEKAEQHYTTAAQHLAEAKEACDDGGFEAFQEKYFPALGRTRVYELLSIATNKKSIEQVRADTRARTARSRAKKKAEASATVADKPEPDPSERQRIPSRGSTGRCSQHRAEAKARGGASARGDVKGRGLVRLYRKGFGPCAQDTRAGGRALCQNGRQGGRSRQAREVPHRPRELDAITSEPGEAISSIPGRERSPAQ